MSGTQGRKEEEFVVSESPFGEVISSYTRQQAIADGELIDVSETAKEAGICYPLCLTRAVWSHYVEVPDGVAHCQDEAGRLWDIVWMLRYGILRSGGGDEMLFKLRVANNDADWPEPVSLKAVCGPGDTALPVITVMLPDED